MQLSCYEEFCILQYQTQHGKQYTLSSLLCKCAHLLLVKDLYDFRFMLRIITISALP